MKLLQSAALAVALSILGAPAALALKDTGEREERSAYEWGFPVVAIYVVEKGDWISRENLCEPFLPLIQEVYGVPELVARMGCYEGMEIQSPDIDDLNRIYPGDKLVAPAPELARPDLLTEVKKQMIARRDLNDVAGDPMLMAFRLGQHGMVLQSLIDELGTTPEGQRHTLTSKIKESVQAAIKDGVPPMIAAAVDTEVTDQLRQDVNALQAWQKETGIRLDTFEEETESALSQLREDAKKSREALQESIEESRGQAKEGLDGLAGRVETLEQRFADWPEKPDWVTLAELGDEIKKQLSAVGNTVDPTSNGGGERASLEAAAPANTERQPPAASESAERPEQTTRATGTEYDQEWWITLAAILAIALILLGIGLLLAKGIRERVSKWWQRSGAGVTQAPSGVLPKDVVTDDNLDGKLRDRGVVTNETLGDSVKAHLPKDLVTTKTFGEELHKRDVATMGEVKAAIAEAGDEAGFNTPVASAVPTKDRLKFSGSKLEAEKEGHERTKTIVDTETSAEYKVKFTSVKHPDKPGELLWQPDLPRYRDGTGEALPVRANRFEAALHTAFDDGRLEKNRVSGDDRAAA